MVTLKRLGVLVLFLLPAMLEPAVPEVRLEPVWGEMRVSCVRGKDCFNVGRRVVDYREVSE